MIRGAATAVLLPAEPLVARLDALVQVASAAFLAALDDSDNPTARLYLERGSPSSRRGVAANSAGTQRPKNHETTTPNPHLPHPEDGSAHHSSKHNFPDCQDTTRLRRLKKLCTPKSVAASDNDRGCVSHVHRTTTPTCKNDCVIGATQPPANAVSVDHSLTLSLSMVKLAAPPKPQGGTMHAFTPFWKD